MKTTELAEVFFELIQIAIGTREATAFTYRLNNEEWSEIYDMSIKQTVAGVVFLGVNKLPAELRPHKELYIKWHILCETIKNRNRKLDKAAENISDKFLQCGFENTILKGQGVAQLYPEPLYRTSGDIDIWLKGKRKDIFRYVKSIVPDSKPFYHHTDFDVSKEVEIEVHFTPSWMFNYFTNRKLQQYFERERDEQMKNTVVTADGTKLHATNNNFNRVYILLHIYRHLFGEGIGLRQLLDYHMVLSQGFSQEELAETIKTLKQLRMTGFAAACMYVLQKVFATKEEYMIVTPDAKQGEFVLNEIMIAGNFGKYDPRQNRPADESLFSTFIRKTKNAFRFVKYHPTEIFWTPIFKIWHLVWRYFYFRFI